MAPGMRALRVYHPNTPTTVSGTPSLPGGRLGAHTWPTNVAGSHVCETSVPFTGGRNERLCSRRRCGAADRVGLGPVAEDPDGGHSPASGRQTQPRGARTADRGRPGVHRRPLAAPGLRHRRSAEGREGWRGPAAPAVGRCGVQDPAGGSGQGRPHLQLHRGRRAALRLRAVSVQDPRDARQHGDPVRSDPLVPADLHGRARAAEGSESRVVRLLGRPLGEGRVRRRELGVQRQRLARQCRCPRHRSSSR